MCSEMQSQRKSFGIHIIDKIISPQFFLHGCAGCSFKTLGIHMRTTYFTVQTRQRNIQDQVLSSDDLPHLKS